MADNPLVFIEDDQYAICEGSDALLVATEWNQFRNPDFDRIKEVSSPRPSFDGRNSYCPLRARQARFCVFLRGKEVGRGGEEDVKTGEASAEGVYSVL